MCEKDKRDAQICFHLFISIYSNWSFSRTYIAMHGSENVKFITVFTTACHLPTSYINSTQSTTDPQIYVQKSKGGLQTRLLQCRALQNTWSNVFELHFHVYSMIKHNLLSGTLNQTNGSLTTSHNFISKFHHVDETAIYQNCKKRKIKPAKWKPKKKTDNQNSKK
jgi:hypothetical protein